MSADKMMTEELISWGIVTQLTVIDSWVVFWSNVECFYVIQFTAIFYK